MKKKAFKIYVMNSLEKEMQGLQHLKPIPDGGFLFDVKNGTTSFHSKNVQEPFVIGALNDKGKVLDIVNMNPPDSLYTTRGERFVLEMSKKFFDGLDLEKGDTVVID